MLDNPDNHLSIYNDQSQIIADLIIILYFKSATLRQGWTL